MGRWVPPVLPPSSFVQGHPDPLVLLSPNTQALAGSRAHFCPAAGAPEQGKRVLRPSSTPPPLYLAPANDVALPAQPDNLNSILFPS